MKKFKLLVLGISILICNSAISQFKAGFLDKTGKEVIPAQFERVNSFSQGLAAVEVNNKWGFIDKTGKIIIPPIYEYALDFKKYDNQVAARVVLNGANKIINELGIVIDEPFIKINADELRPFSINGYLRGYKDINGKVVVPEIYSLAEPFEGGYGVVFDMEKGGGLIDVTGKLMMPLTPDFLPIYSEGVFIIKRNGNYELVNEQLKTVVILDKIPNLQQCENFQNGLAPIKVNDKWGLMNKKGEIVLLPQYENCITFYDGVAKAKKDGIIGLINTKGEPIGNVRDKEYWGFSEGLSVYRPMDQSGRQYQGFIDKTGAVVIPVQYSMLENFSEGLAKFEKNVAIPEVKIVATTIENSNISSSNTSSSTKTTSNGIQYSTYALDIFKNKGAMAIYVNSTMYVVIIKDKDPDNLDTAAARAAKVVGLTGNYKYQWFEGSSCETLKNKYGQAFSVKCGYELSL
jgi:hypothetical protein